MILIKFTMKVVTEELLYFESVSVTKCLTNVGEHILTVSDAEHNNNNKVIHYLLCKLTFCTNWIPAIHTDRYRQIQVFSNMRMKLFFLT